MKVAIAGYGVEGKINYDYWRRLGHDVTIVDERELTVTDLPQGSNVILGNHALDSLQDFELVIRTASLPPRNIKTRGKVWSATNEFFDKCPAPIIGVTGTKGKGTTSSLIASILRAAGKTVHLVGNIGLPALSVLPDIKETDIVVFELSSFQLWDLEKSPHIAVVLMIEPEHLDVHADFEDYISAKSNIRLHHVDGDICIYHPTNEWSYKVATSTEQGSHCRYGVADDNQAYVSSNTFFIQENAICSVKALQLVGKHNLENACAAISAAWIFTNDSSAIEAGLQSFTGLDHRIKRIRGVHNVTYYDDNYSTASAATLAAIHSFSDDIYLICGGYDRGLDYEEMAKGIVESTNVKKVLLIGQTKEKIAHQLEQHGFRDFEILSSATMADIVRRAASVATPGSIVLMSPGCASFDMFDNFTDRGNQFIQEVNVL